MIITDRLVDEMTHIYDGETHGDEKGRNASSQLAWQLQAKHADAFMRLIYGQNDNFGKIRKRLISLGYDMDENDCPVKGYSPHSMTVKDDLGDRVLQETIQS